MAMKKVQTEQEYKQELLEEQAAKVIQRAASRGLLSRFKKKIPFVKMMKVATRLATLNILTT